MKNYNPINKDVKNMVKKLASVSASQGDPQVKRFIKNCVYHEGKENAETIWHFFRAGYCYYFAHMIKIAFHRGTVCWAAPLGHFVWCDEDGTPYDIEGIYFGEAEEFIPEEYLGDMIKDFLHVPDVAYNATEEDITKCLERYRKDKK